jgi:shikimate dehydrogenase
VTIPHKIRIMGLLDEIDPLAEVIGAVNTICLTEGRTRGYNTDGNGFLTSLEKQLETKVDDKNIFILGSGGAARGIAMTLASKGVPKIFLCNRTSSKAEDLSEEINAKIRPCAEPIRQAVDVMAKTLPHCDILINATSVGMHPHDDAIPLDEGLLFKELAVADLVYSPLMTRLLKAAQRRGCPMVNGQGMLIYQGALAFKLWTGQEPLVGEMFAALGEPLS